MAAVSDSAPLPEKFEKLNLSKNVEKYNDSQENSVEYGLPLPDVYKLALNFYKGNFCNHNFFSNYLDNFRERRKSGALQL